MNTRVVDPRTLWALLALEAGLALPIISLPTQGDRIRGPLGPLLIIALLPLGYAVASRSAGAARPELATSGRDRCSTAHPGVGL